MSSYCVYSELDFIEIIRKYIRKEEWDKAYNTLQEYLKYYSSRKSTICEYMFNLIVNLINKGYKPNNISPYTGFNIDNIKLRIYLTTLSITSIQDLDINEPFKITPFIYKTFKSLLNFSYTYQVNLIIPEKTRLFINPLVNRLGFIMRFPTDYPGRVVIIQKKPYLSIIDIYE